MSQFYWRVGVIMAVLMILAAVMDPLIRGALAVILALLLGAVGLWLMYHLVTFSSGYKSRLFDAAHRRDEV